MTHPTLSTPARPKLHKPLERFNEVECEACDGEGHVEKCDASGWTWGDLETCDECYGAGVVEVEIEEEDA